MTDLEGRALDEALARAIGWVWLEPAEERGDGGAYWRQPSGNIRPVESWHNSLDRLLRDIEPVCRERGMVDVLMEWATTNNASRPWRVSCSVNDEPDAEFASGPTAATALARAFLAVLTRGERKSPPLLTGS